MIRGYFHVACMGGGALIAAELHGRLISSGLYSAADEINVCLAGDISQAQWLNANIFAQYPKYKVDPVIHDLTEWEWPTLYRLEADAKSGDDQVFYLHTKGASNTGPGGFPPQVQRNIVNWRAVMAHEILDRWQECLKALETADACGPCWLKCNKGNEMFGGNFWWANTSYIRTLPHAQPEFRNDAELWISWGKDWKWESFTRLHKQDIYGFDGGIDPLKGYPGSIV